MGSSAPTAAGAAALGLAASGRPLPFAEQIQASFGGIDVGAIATHQSAETHRVARALGAEAYTLGDVIGFRGSPTLHTAAHEAAHVVQQRAGARPTDSGERRACERHADAVADLVVQGRSAEALLQEVPVGAGGSASEAGVVQLKADSPEGSAMLLTSSAATEVTSCNAFTPQLVELLNENPDKGIDQIAEEITTGMFRSAKGMSSHPAMAQLGEMAADVKGSKEPWKGGLFIYNADYARFNDVPAAEHESNALKAAVSARGYNVVSRANMTASEMKDRYSSVFQHVTPGDRIVASYVGHGLPKGLVGVDYTEEKPDLLTNEAVSALMQAAVARGAHLQFLVTACYSGNLADAVREDQARELGSLPLKAGEQDLLAAAALAAECREELLLALDGYEEFQDKFRTTLAHYKERKARLAHYTDLVESRRGEEAYHELRAKLRGDKQEAHENFINKAQEIVGKVQRQFGAKLEALWPLFHDALEKASKAVSVVLGEKPLEWPDTLVAKDVLRPIHVLQRLGTLESAALQAVEARRSLAEGAL